jgi:hypothetical protein
VVEDSWYRGMVIGDVRRNAELEPLLHRVGPSEGQEIANAAMAGMTRLSDGPPGTNFRAEAVKAAQLKF